MSGNVSIATTPSIATNYITAVRTADGLGDDAICVMASWEIPLEKCCFKDVSIAKSELSWLVGGGDWNMNLMNFQLGME